MNIPAELAQLQEFLWNQIQDADRREEAFSTVASILRELAQGIWLPVCVALILALLAALLYQPRIPRGALWVPSFGIFGNAPKFYAHTRPASFCGIFLKSRHRVTTHRRRRA